MKMNRKNKIDKVIDMLTKSGFFAFRTDGKSFDVIARRDNTLLLIKYGKNIDCITPFMINELNNMSNFLNAVPLIIGEKNNIGKIETGIVYSRRGVPVTSIKTLEEILYNGIYPLMYSSPGGLFVNLDSKELRRIRKEKNISLGELAKASGVSRKAVQLYEKNMSAKISVSIRIEKYLDTEIITPIDVLTKHKINEKYMQIETIFEKMDALNKVVINELKKLRYNTLPLFYSPFNTIAKYNTTVVIGDIEKSDVALYNITKTITKISKISEKSSIFFVDECEKDNIDGIPVIRVKELKEMDEPDEIIELANERK